MHLAPDLLVVQQYILMEINFSTVCLLIKIYLSKPTEWWSYFSWKYILSLFLWNKKNNTTPVYICLSFLCQAESFRLRFRWGFSSCEWNNWPDQFQTVQVISLVSVHLCGCNWISGAVLLTGQLVLTAVMESRVSVHWWDGCFHSTYAPLICHFYYTFHERLSTEHFWSNINNMVVVGKLDIIRNEYVSCHCHLFFLFFLHTFSQWILLQIMNIIGLRHCPVSSVTMPPFLSHYLRSCHYWKISPHCLLWDKSNICPDFH